MELFNKNPGFKFNFKRLLRLRFEAVNVLFDDVNQEDFEVIMQRFLLLLGPLLSSFKKRSLLYVYSLHVMNVYRG